MATLYLLLAIVGALVPVSQLIPWVLDHGLDIPLLIAELFSTRIGAFFGLDVVVSAVVLFIFIATDGARRGIKHLWLPVAATCLIGVSCGLPLFLFLRERQAAARGAA